MAYLSKSTFTLTFAVELVEFEVWHDCNEGWIDLGPIQNGMKFQYQLSPGYSYDVDVAIWPHTAKIACGQENCWVRTWQFLERRWLAFSISHAIPVRVVDFQQFEVVITPTAGVTVIGSAAKSDIPSELYIPPLSFGERRYFGPVETTLHLPEVEKLKRFMREWIWGLVVEFIPASYLDGPFDVPNGVKDIRHQDTILYNVQEKILNSRNLDEEDLMNSVSLRRVSNKGGKEKKKGAEAKAKFELMLPGDTILAGIGRIITFDAYGEKPVGVGEVIVLISSCNLPAPDDLPIVFINVSKLFNAPLEDLKRLNVTHLYTRWILGDEIRDSQIFDIRSKKAEREIDFNDHHALPLKPQYVTQVTALFLDDFYEVQLRGMRSLPVVTQTPKLFGYEKDDRDFAKHIPRKVVEQEVDFIIANTRINARTLAKGISAFISMESPLYAPRLTVAPLLREQTCTNDMNLIGAPLVPQLIVPTCVILKAQMTLEVSLGVVGCRAPRLTPCYSRFYCLISDSDCTLIILFKMWEINEKCTDNIEEKLTGFALDTGQVVVFFIEGPKEGNILKIWDLTESLHPKVKPLFSTSARYSTRIYPEFLHAMPFIVLKMHVPLNIVLACPSVYARPTLPLPCRITALKLGRLIQNRYRTFPPRQELPTANELQSFRLELCAPPRAYRSEIQAVIDNEKTNKRQSIKDMATESHLPKECPTDFVGRINWEGPKD